MDAEERRALMRNLIFNMPLQFKKTMRVMMCENVDMKKLRVITVLNNLEHASMTDYSKIMGLPKSNLTMIVNELVKDGYVVRRFDETDRRMIFLDVTDTGRQFAEDGMALFEEHIANNITSALSDEDIINLNFHIGKVFDILKKLY